MARSAEDRKSHIRKIVGHNVSGAKILVTTGTTKIVEGRKVVFRPAASIAASTYPGFDERSYTLKKGSVNREGGMPLGADILVEQDVPVTLRDGTVIRTDIYRPVDGADCPAIIGWSPYGKRGSVLSNDGFGHPTRLDVPTSWEDGLNKFEAPNPGYWVAHGYAVIAPDPRGVFSSEGDIHAWGEQEPSDEYDLIEWVAQQPWSNGKVGLTGNSMLAMSQWFVAAKRPPHLAAIAPWEGASDIYRDATTLGGVPDAFFVEGIFGHLCGKSLIEDVPAMAKLHPLINDYWKSKIPDLSKIEVPAYIVASWTNVLHTGGTFRAWESISSKEKWLRVNNTHEWTDYYDPQHVDDLRRFFDTYLKGIDNGWSATPRVRLTVLDPGGTDILNRPEVDFPLARQTVVPLYLDAAVGGGLLSKAPPSEAAKLSYDSADKEGVTFTLPIERDTELTGYFKLKLWVSAESTDDMDIFAYVRKRDRDGKVQEASVVTDRTHVGPNGRLRVSLRRVDEARSTELRPFLPYDKEEKLNPGEIVPVEIGFWPYGIKWQPGETLELLVTGTDLLVRPEFPQFPSTPTLNRGRHEIHFGGKYGSHLLVPLIEGL